MRRTLRRRAVGALRLAKPVAQSSLVDVAGGRRRIVVDDDLRRDVLGQLSRLFRQRVTKLWLLHRRLHRAVRRHIPH